ncbi:hypothetical protein GCM10011354_32970 [Egicoccus halophilus]|uniref:Uncharacterized protein n=2 Tax=Egicoccus halophilus TaxID=1670830 RepID=A0A8J3EVZ8_9ACTN|nr:hypothetical protein GCM10011354_32970 [Egicoccus halophilus]
MARFEVRQTDPKRFDPRDIAYEVVDTQSGHAVASFPDRDEAQAHADRLEQGPFDLDEQDRRRKEQDDWGTWESWD